MTNNEPNRSGHFYRIHRDLVVFKMVDMFWIPVNTMETCRINGTDDEVGEKRGQMKALLTTRGILIA
ncbi:hypothetical protein T265_11192 [Opisthorchis viverrini]|uniref:Uncharacterized protein n=1 Tax=Opisthorchis viverrini TaxID=6198 RepID=A0A074ZYH0_OPIVI|nr:hypothetical protein T265_11192 [Opisthorchis viverrini]KER20194.1 hypothetical protein T265_11192 [Opisthorchis viverrini]